MNRHLIRHVSRVALPACAFALAAYSTAAAERSRIAGPISDADRVVLHGNTHPLARAEFDRGAAPDSLPAERMMLVLQRSPEQEAALAKLLEEQQNPSSPNFHRWLTPAEFGARFGPSQADLAQVTAWLQSRGFEVGSVSNGRRVVEFSGTAGQVAATFHTPIHRFVVKGKEHWANVRDPEIPRALSPIVAGIASLHNFEKKPASHAAGVFRRDNGTGKVTALSRPNFTFTAGDVFWALGPTDFATIYNVLPAWADNIDGTGQTIAITQRSNINPSDVSDFRALFGLPANPVVVTVNGVDPGLTGSESEALIDVEWSGAVAKGATINMVTSKSTNTTDGVDLSAQYIVDNNVAPIMSTSFGLCELFLGNTGNQFFYTLWQQAAAQGITSFVSTGDSGAAGCDEDFGAPSVAFYGLQVSGLASTPFNVAVGGTDFIGNLTNPSAYWSATNDPTTKASALSYIPENVWNNSCANPLFGTNPVTSCNDPANLGFVDLTGGSGGKSNCVQSRGSFLPGSCVTGYPKPTWQVAPGVPADPHRAIPDVSLFASNGFLGSFYIVCQADQTPDGTCNLDSPFADFLGFGGTSVSSPAFAGIMALINQHALATSGQGNPNPVFYKLAAGQTASKCNSSTGPASTCVFNDITTGSNVMPCMSPSTSCSGNGAEGVGALLGYKTTPGYDLATGLGSVNVANLVNAWPVSTIEFGSATYTAKETGMNAMITVTRTGSSLLPVSATWTVTGGTAAQGTDFTTATGTVTIPAGKMTATFSFPVKHDTVAGDKTVDFTLSNPTGGAVSLGAQATTELTITNVDVPGTIQFSATALSVTPKATGTTTVNLMVTRTGGMMLASGVSVVFTAVDGTAVAGTDYTVTTTSPLVFGYGVASQKIVIQVPKVSHGGANPTFSVTLSSPDGGAVLGTKTTETVTIKE